MPARNAWEPSSGSTDPKGDAMRTYTIPELPHARVLGRTCTGEDGALTLFWTASGVELLIRAPRLDLRYRADYEAFEPWLDIVIDGARTQRVMLSAGEHELTVFRSPLPSGAPMDGSSLPLRHVMILRDTPAMPDDGRNLLQLLSLSFEGECLPLPEPSLRLEFIGDSITSGEGGCGASSHMDWDSECFDAVDNYAFLTARSLGASYHVLSQSGWGVYCNFLGDVARSLPPYYDRVCGILPSPCAARLGAQEPWDFQRFSPDAIIVNLGTNDIGAFSVDTRAIAEQKGEKPAMFLAPDGTMDPSCREKIASAVYSFLKDLRRHNPQATLIWAYGMLLQSSDILNGQMQLTLSLAVSDYRRDTGDDKVLYLQLPPTLPGEYGSRFHPGLPSHQKTARVLTEKLRELFPL